MSARRRPIGVTIVGVLYLIMAVLAFVAAMGYLQWAGLADFWFASQTEAPFWLMIGGGYLLTYLGLFTFMIVAVDLIMAVGCFRGWGWVWSFGVFFALIQIGLSLFNSLSHGFTVDQLWNGLIEAIVPILVLIYLSTRKVRVFFGKA